MGDGNDIRIKSLSEYMRIVEELKRNYPTRAIINNPIEKVFLYRGHGDKAYKLIPSLFRITEENFGEQVITNNKYLAFAKEKDILMTFIQEAKMERNIDTTDYFHWAEVAQHYGVPTRFLDWTQNPLVALYFASSSSEDKDGEVWILHGLNYDRICAKELGEDNKMSRGELITKVMNEETTVKYPTLYTPYYIETRMKAQSSYFLVWGTENIPLEELFDDEKFLLRLPEDEKGVKYGREQKEGILLRVIVPGYAKQPLLRELDLVGISARTLFPDMMGLGQYVEWKYRFNYQEALSNL